MKYKKIPIDYLKVCIDRLTRFKPVYSRYERVFDDILSKFAFFDPKVDEISSISLERKCEIVEEIFNSSVEIPYDSYISDLLFKEENAAFNLDEVQMRLLQSKLNLTGALKLVREAFGEDLPLNLKRLAVCLEHRDDLNFKGDFELLYPVKKVILTEGATEEILLPVFGEIFGFNFVENGVYVLGAGGKNQVARKYYKMRDEIKLPVFILLDSDAVETNNSILPVLKAKDRVYMIKTGEFEDILPLELIINALNANFKNEFHCSKEDFDLEQKMTSNLHELFKNKGFGEYKKAEFAKIVKNYLLSKNKLQNSPEIQAIIDEIKNL